MRTKKQQMDADAQRGANYAGAAERFKKSYYDSKEDNK